MTEPKKKTRPRKRTVFRRLLLVVFDVLAVTAAAVLAVAVSAERRALVTQCAWEPLLTALLLNAVTLVASFSLMRLYSTVYAYADLTVGLLVTGCCALTACMHELECALLFKLGEITSFDYLFEFFFILLALTGLARFGRRALRAIRVHWAGRKTAVPVMIVGAGDAGATLMREMMNSAKMNYEVRCLIDDDPNKRGNTIYGVRVAGTRDDIPALAKKYKIREIIIALPAAGGEVVRQIAEICQRTKCTVKKVPGLYQLVNGEVSLSVLREVSIEDLLERDAIKVDLDSILGYVNDQVVMVTGGGGSIGSELCRQLASHNPRKLIIVDIYENNAYDIQQELTRNYPALDLVTLIASVRDKKRLERIFSFYRPQIVFHAAAHKHVPLMEESPNEAIKNNVFGTFNTAQMADKYGVKRFVLISTDKAVNPTNVMGATKRICEMIVQSFAKKSKTEFVAVRFGNVLGSNGSVVPLFRKQIASGGPVLVTHPDIIRYFMTIPEAVALVIQAGAYAHGGEIFVLDMGKPVKILDLAENIIRLSGYEPYKDIDIRFTGLRPGEKLYEEMLMDEEGLQETENRLIHIGKPIEMDEEVFFRQLEELREVLKNEPEDTRRLISEIVPTYKGNTQLKNL